MYNGTEQKDVLPSQFMLTPDQRIALLEAKLARAEQYAKALAELAKKLKRS